MITCDLSQINFDAIAFPRKTKTFKNVVQLFSACHYDEAETIAKKLVGYDPQLADMRAQIAFFRSDFNACVQQALLLYPFLNAWYSENKTKETQRMLAFALRKADAPVRQEAFDILMQMHQHFSQQELDKRGFEHFKSIPLLLEHASGDLVRFAVRNYTPPDDPKPLSAVTESYLECHKNRLAKLSGDPLENPAVLSSLLVSVKAECRPEDYLAIYQKYCTSPQLRNAHFPAAAICLYLQQYDRAKEALLNFAKYGFTPIEWTDVKPMAIFFDYCVVPLFDNAFLERIDRLPVPGI
ncbi:MAG TPA: hypothetical protein DCG49_11695 [Ruminococcus sp.]|nr:hypothetical protein [Ruminococcus sp.]